MRLKFYTANINYCDFLRLSDPCVPHVHDTKNTRPFVGIILSVGEFNYFAPLSSPKPKFAKMKNQINFLKINEGIWGAINLNNMIPIHPNCLTEVNMEIFTTDSKSDVDYKNLLSNQLSWCNSNRIDIQTRAMKLYKTIIEGLGWESLTNRCCDFLKDEVQYKEFCKQNGYTSIKECK